MRVNAGIGRRIAETRKRAGRDVEDVAAAARIRADDLRALEDGRPTVVSTAAVARIARALDVDIADLAEERPLHTSQPSLFFKQRDVPDFFDKDRAHVVSALQEARAIAVLDEILGKRYKRASFEPVAMAAVPFKQGYELAQRVRRVLGVPREPLGNIVQLTEDEFGVPVVGAALQTRTLLALTAKERETKLVAVIVNGTRASHRRVDIAHELAHVLFDAPEKEIDYWLDLENDHVSETEKTEQRARAFSAELLIPQEGLVEQFGLPNQRSSEQRASLASARELVLRVAAHFRTPPELTTNHLVNHLYIAPHLRDAAWRGLELPPGPPQPSRPKMLHRRVAEALGAGLITQMRAREFLDLSARDPLPDDVWQA